MTPKDKSGLTPHIGWLCKVAGSNWLTLRIELPVLCSLGKLVGKWPEILQVLYPKMKNRT